MVEKKSKHTLWHGLNNFMSTNQLYRGFWNQDWRKKIGNNIGRGCSKCCYNY